MSALSPRRFSMGAAAGLLVLLAASASPSAAQTVAPRPGTPAQPVVRAPITLAQAAPTSTTRPASRRRVPPRTYARPMALTTVQSANRGARDYPRAGAYVNAALYYDFEPGRLYTVNTSPRFLTAISLRPGEKLVSKAAGDTVRWVLGETVQGSGATQQVIVMVKPIRGGLRTNIILTTDQRTYLLEAVSHEGDTYTSVIAWNYPQDEAREAQASQAAESRGIAASGLAVDSLHFGYRIKANGFRAPRWQPVRVFDDGLKTYIQFPRDMATTEAPPLFLIGPDKQAQLVNYRYLGGYYVVDRLIDVAELRLGERKQTVVRITRTGDGGGS
jgi:P-type conjugative transfer protein TrbG